MEFVLILLLIGLSLAGYFFIKFSMFKSRLMNAFGQMGIPYNVADQIYFEQAKYINSLYGAGHTAEDIAVHMAEKYGLK